MKYRNDNNNNKNAHIERAMDIKVHTYARYIECTREQKNQDVLRRSTLLEQQQKNRQS